MAKKKEKLPDRLEGEDDEAYAARCAELSGKKPTEGAYKLYEVPRTNDEGNSTEVRVIDSSDDLEAISNEFLRIAGNNPKPDVQQYVLMDEDGLPLMAG